MNLPLFMRAIILSLVFIILTSCSSIRIDERIKKYNLPDNGLVLNVSSNQKELRIRKDNVSFNPQFSILAVELDKSYLNNRRNKQLNSVLASLKDYDFNAVIETELKNSIGKVDWLQVNTNEKINNLHRKKRPIGTHNMNIEYIYEFPPSMDAIEVTVLIQIEKVISTRTQRRKPISRYKTMYENSYKYISKIITPADILDSANLNSNLSIPLKQKKSKLSPLEKIQLMTEYWEADNASKVKTYLKEAVIELKPMIAFDLSYKKNPIGKEFHNNIKRYNQFYLEIDRKTDRVTLEGNSIYSRGVLCSIPLKAKTYRCANKISH